MWRANGSGVVFTYVDALSLTSVSRSKVIDPLDPATSRDQLLKMPGCAAANSFYSDISKRRPLCEDTPRSILSYHLSSQPQIYGVSP